MNTKKLEYYLRDIKLYQENTIESRTSSCKRIERIYGNLDYHYRKNKCKLIIGDLNKSLSDFSTHEHKIQISNKADYVNVTRTLLNSIELYRDCITYFDQVPTLEEFLSQDEGSPVE